MSMSCHKMGRLREGCAKAVQRLLPAPCCLAACRCLSSPRPRPFNTGAGTLTQNNMVVSKLWLAGHLLPDLKPYTRKGGPASSDARRPWERKGAAAAAAPGGGGAGAGGKAAGGQPGGKAAGGKSGNGGAELPPLLQVLTSQDSISSICGSASMDAFGGGSRASILESITAGSQVGRAVGLCCAAQPPRGMPSTSALRASALNCARLALLTTRHPLSSAPLAATQAPADIVQLLLESIALNSTANIYTDKDGEVLFTQVVFRLATPDQIDSTTNQQLH